MIYRGYSDIAKNDILTTQRLVSRHLQIFVLWELAGMNSRCKCRLSIVNKQTHRFDSHLHLYNKHGFFQVSNTTEAQVSP